MDYESDASSSSSSSEDDDSSIVTAASETDEDLSEDDDDHFVETPTKSKKNKHKANSALAVGYKHNRSFVLRGSEIAVYSQNEDKKMRFETTIDLKNLSPFSSVWIREKGLLLTIEAEVKHVEPAKMMLHQGDAAMVLHDTQNPNDLLKLDLESGRIVEHWVHLF